MRGLCTVFAILIASACHAGDTTCRPTTIGELSNGSVSNGVAVRVEGLVADAFQDETNRRYVFLLLRDGNDSIYVGVETDSPSDYGKALPLIGARAAITGESFHFIVPKRIHTGRSVIARGLASIHVLKPAPDPFAAPELDISPYVGPDVIARASRRRTVGKVLAVWQPRSFLIRTKRFYGQTTNMVLRVECMDDSLPVCGDAVEVAGLPETDLYRINLSRAVWRPVPPMDFPTEPVERVSARQILTGDDSRSGIDYLLQGRTVRTSGIVRSLPHDVEREQCVYLDDDGLTVSVDVSALPQSLPTPEIGAKVEATGVCIFDIDNWRPNAVFPQIKGFRLVPRATTDIRVLAAPPWWTPVRIFAVLAAFTSLLIAIIIWNLALRRRAERRGRELAAESVARAESDLKVLERNRLAVELHDSIAQYMTGSSMEIRTALQAFLANEPGTDTHLNLALKAIDASRAELRNCIWDLRNNTLESSDPNEAIRLAVAPHLGDTALSVRFNIPRERLTDNTLHALLCIIRELAVNAIRHGGATEIRVAGALENGQLLCSVRDNGCGFDPNAAPGMEEGHFGLQGIRERLKERRGTLTFASQPGKGTKAMVSIELGKPANP